MTGNLAMLTGFLTIWVATAFGLWLVARLVPGVRSRSARGLWLAALVLGLINAFIRPLFYWLTLPLNVLTFGTFALVLNAVLLRLVSWFVPEFEVRGFLPAITAAAVLALLGLLGMLLFSWLMLGSPTWTIDSPAHHGIYM